MCVATTEPTTPPADDAAADDREMLFSTDQFECPRCSGVIPLECVKGRTDPHSLEPTRRVVMVYCPHCVAGFEADFVLRDGRPVKASRARLVMDADRLAPLLRQWAHVRGDVDRLVEGGLVEKIAAGYSEAVESDKARLARAIERTAARLATLQEEYRSRFDSPRPLSPEERAGLDALDADSGAAAARAEAHDEASRPACGLGGVPSPQPSPPRESRFAGITGPACDTPPAPPGRTIDTSTSQDEDPERFDGLS